MGKTQTDCHKLTTSLAIKYICVEKKRVSETDNNNHKTRKMSILVFVSD